MHCGTKPSGMHVVADLMDSHLKTSANRRTPSKRAYLKIRESDFHIAAAPFFTSKFLDMLRNIISKYFTFTVKDWDGVCILSGNYPTSVLSLKCLALINSHLRGFTVTRAHKLRNL